ncbi:hypothetical protein FIBSPDRAFT_885788 [Athelia psychrophila]|uniref:Uncharacterized protein n=1 Tax=Athelia psychrophila TaxID=1759441 RepID=A0A166RR10_9AGAM|nr:hypothetical protein FIBSPDRAFT_885788 [Fibularhizoctonia sp. CBS 109695]
MQSLELTYGFTNSLVTKWFSVPAMLLLSASSVIWFTYVLLTGLNTKTATREMMWNWSLVSKPSRTLPKWKSSLPVRGCKSSLSVVSVIVTYFWRLSGSVEDSFPNGIPGAQWCQSNQPRWWVMFLLGGSAVAEALIGISCLLLADMERGMANEPRRAMLSFFIFISAGCTIGIAMSLAMVVCHLQSATVPWDVMSMLAPISEVDLSLPRSRPVPRGPPLLPKQFARGRGSTSTCSDVSRSASASPTRFLTPSPGSGTSIVETLVSSDTVADEDVYAIWQLRPASIASSRSPPHLPPPPPSYSSTV